MKKKEILAQHSQKIWQGLDGNWHTHIIMEDGKRVVRHRKTREELEDYLVDYYKKLEESVYIKDVFWKWMNEKLDYGEIKKQSYDKYCAEFKRFFPRDNFICIKKMKNITEEDLERFIKTTIRDMELTRKAYSGLVTLLNGILSMGKRWDVLQSVFLLLLRICIYRRTFSRRILRIEKKKCSWKMKYL